MRHCKPKNCHNLLCQEKKQMHFLLKILILLKNIKVPTVYWFANIDNNCMMWTCWKNDLSNILRRVIITTNIEVQINIIE